MSGALFFARLLILAAYIGMDWYKNEKAITTKASNRRHKASVSHFFFSVRPIPIDSLLDVLQLYSLNPKCHKGSQIKWRGERPYSQLVRYACLGLGKAVGLDASTAGLSDYLRSLW